MLRKIRVMLIVALFLAFFSGAANALDGAVKVDVNIDGKVTSLNTNAETVGELLESMSAAVSEDDVISHDLDDPVEKDMLITIKRPFMVTANVDGAAIHLRVADGSRVSVAKEKVEAKIQIKTKLLNASDTDFLSPNMVIELATSYVESSDEYAPIPFEIVYVENSEVLEGMETVLEEGEDGLLVSVVESQYEGETLVSKDAVETRVIKEPISRLIERGTKPLKPTVPGAPGNLTYSKVITMRASAYTTDRGDSGPITATGEKCRVGLVAVDPKFIPLGTMLYVENYGICRAADTGGMIKGDAIDLFFNTYNECYNFGRRPVTVYVLDATREELGE